MGILGKIFGASSTKARRQLCDIGFDGTLPEFTAALNEKYDILGDNGGIPHVELLAGAVDALTEGRPENIQSFFSSGFGNGALLANAMTGLTATQLATALATTGEGQRQQILDDALQTLAGRDGAASEIKALLIAGANANVNDGGPLRAAFAAASSGNIETLRHIGNASYSAALKIKAF